MSNTGPSNFDKISPTAFMTGLARQFTDIPFSKEIAEIVTEQRVTGLPLILESRYKAINKMLARYSLDQYLELASGFLPRGFEMTADSSVVYVESDLHEMIGSKAFLANKIGIKRSNLHFMEIDATARPNQWIERAEGSFDASKPVAVLCEGLLMYLTTEEKAAVCENVRGFLERYGGVWVTPDFTTTVGLKQSATENPGLQKRMDALKETTGRSLPDNSFATIDEAREFVGQFGFQIDEMTMGEVIDDLSCVEILGLEREMVERVLAGRSVFALTI